MKNKKILYQEVSDSIKKDIIEGKYPLNTYVPTEIELEKMFDVSKITVRKAIQILCNEGYLVKQSGKGTEVISNRPFNILSKASSFTTVLEKQGNVVTKSILSVEETDLVTDMTFKHDRVIEIIRLFEIKEEPAIFFKHYISVPKNSDLNSIQTENFSLYIDDQFSAVEATEEVKNRLDLSKEFVLKRVRQSFDKDNQLVEYTVAFYDSDKQPYIIDYEV
jgi:DNA-binding GntR family transcriptional regulator